MTREEQALGKKLQEIAHLEGGPLWMGKPDRWWEKPHWRCVAGHISTMLLKRESHGDYVCLECYGQVWLTFPEDVDGPLREAECFRR